MTGGWDLGSHCGKLELPPVVYGFSLLPPRHSIKKCGDGTSKSWRYGLDVKSSLSFFVIVVCFCFRTCFIFHLACWRANFERQLYWCYSRIIQHSVSIGAGSQRHLFFNEASQASNPLCEFKRDGFVQVIHLSFQEQANRGTTILICWFIASLLIAKLDAAYFSVRTACCREVTGLGLEAKNSKKDFAFVSGKIIGLYSVGYSMLHCVSLQKGIYQQIPRWIC